MSDPLVLSGAVKSSRSCTPVAAIGCVSRADGATNAETTGETVMSSCVLSEHEQNGLLRGLEQYFSCVCLSMQVLA